MTSRLDLLAVRVAQGCQNMIPIRTDTDDVIRSHERTLSAASQAMEMRQCEVESGVIVMHQGEVGDRLYVTYSGKFEMIQNGKCHPSLASPTF